MEDHEADVEDPGAEGAGQEVGREDVVGPGVVGSRPSSE